MKEPWRVVRKITHHSLNSLHLVCFDYQPTGRQKPMVNDNQLDPVQELNGHPKIRGRSHIKVAAMFVDEFKSSEFRLPLSLTNVGVAQAYANPGPKGDFCVVSVRACFVNFFTHSTKRYLMEWADIVTFHPEHPKWDQKLQFTPQSAETTIDRGTFPSLLYGSPPGPQRRVKERSYRCSTMP